MFEAEQIACVRIGLRGIAPEIWRRVEVPLSLHLKALHDVIQAVFLWQDYHLFEFRIGGRIYGIPAPDEDFDRKVLQARSMRLATLFANGVDRFDYIYDLGDGWDHAVVIESVGDAEPGQSYPRFVDGARRGPPEDVGGTGGYGRFLAAVLNRRHPEHRRLVTWYGGPYDPDDIGLREVQRRLGVVVARRESGKARYKRSLLLRPVRDGSRNEVFVSGTEGYAAEADALLRQYESRAFADVHAEVLHLIPSTPCRVLDIGAGTGRDAAGFAALGHDVVAVEPTGALRIRAQALHPSPRITWVNDSLPALVRLRGFAPFDVVMLTAVWMHLDAAQRREAMPNVAALVRPGGVMILSLRHGPVPPGRRMFAVSADETEELAAAHGLHVVLKREGRPARPGKPGVTWTRLAFAAGDRPG